MDFGGEKKRGRDGVNGNGSFKKPRQETESFTPGIGSKSKPCTKFFSASGCPFGEGCHFLHYVPGGVKAVTEMLGSNPALPNVPRNQLAPPPSFPDEYSSQFVKSRMCTKFNTPEGCKFGDKCRFAHGERELGRQTFSSSHNDPRFMGQHQAGGRYGSNRMDPNPNFGAASSFGATATAKISIDASMAGAVIGKGGVNSKQICRETGAKLSIRDHDSDTNLKNIELEGSFDQIKQASQMVHELIVNLRSSSGPQVKNNHGMPFGHGRGLGKNLKTKICENFERGSCTFGDKCNFAHGAEELRKTGM